MTQVAIWWMNQTALSLAQQLGGADAPWPEYIKTAFAEANEWYTFGGGYDDLFRNPAGLPFDRIDESKFASCRELLRFPGGILIRQTDSHHVLTWPGVVTDLELRPLTLSDVRY